MSVQKDKVMSEKFTLNKTELKKEEKGGKYKQMLIVPNHKPSSHCPPATMLL